MRHLSRAPWLLLLVACTGKEVDDGASDTGDDAVGDTDDSKVVDTDDAPPPPTEVAVTVLDPFGGPFKDMFVVFHAPDGSVASVHQTDARGKVRAEIDADSALTIRPNSGLLTTVTSISPGDELVLVADPGGRPTDVGTAFTSLTTFPGSDFYIVMSGCGLDVGQDASYVFEVPFGMRCTTDGAFDLLAVAHKNGEFAAWTSRTGIAVQANTSSVTLDMPSTWRDDWTQPEISATNAPEGGWYFEAELIPFRHGFAYDPDRKGDEVESGRASVQPKIVKDFATEAQITASFFMESHYSARAEVLLRSSDAPPDHVEIDGSRAPLPPTEGYADDTDPARPVVTWSGGTALAVAVLDVGYVTEDGTATWRFVVPGDTDTIRVPELPEDLAHLAPIEGFRGRQIVYTAASVDDLDDDQLRLREADRLWTALLREGDTGGRRAKTTLTLPK